MLPVDELKQNIINRIKKLQTERAVTGGYYLYRVNGRSQEHKIIDAGHVESANCHLSFSLETLQGFVNCRLKLKLLSYTQYQFNKTYGLFVQICRMVLCVYFYSTILFMTESAKGIGLRQNMLFFVLNDNTNLYNKYHYTSARK